MNRKQMIARALKAAKFLVSWRAAGPGEEFICIAIKNACKAGLISEDQRNAARFMIRERLDGEETVEGWLLRTLGSEVVRAAPVDSIQEFRHLWLDELILEFSK
jgi:hypothetical protein